MSLSSVTTIVQALKTVMVEWLRYLSLYNLVLRATEDDDALKDLRSLLSEVRKSTLAMVRCVPTPAVISCSHYVLSCLVLRVGSLLVISVTTMT
jgi:hypothetical protein